MWRMNLHQAWYLFKDVTHLQHLKMSLQGLKDQHLRKIDIPESMNDPHHSRIYSDNKVRTSKYTPLTFLPKNLIE